MALNLFTVPPETPFLDAIARGWLAGGMDPLTVSRGLILLPTRRAARSLAESFLRANDGKPLLLPRITALGALDEAPLALSGALDLPPAVGQMRRLAALSRLILGMNGAGGAPRTADRAWPLARELASLMDEAERAGIDLAERLPDAADPAFAHHWAETLKFLHIVTRVWPEWLADNGFMNPAARQVALLDTQAAAWEQDPPAFRVLVAGTTAGIPAVGRLLRVVARLPAGQVVLPQLDLLMNEEAWEAMEPSHPQAGLARLLGSLDAGRGEVGVWGGPAPTVTVGAGHGRLVMVGEERPSTDCGAGGEKGVDGRPSPTMTSGGGRLLPTTPSGGGITSVPTQPRFAVLSRALLPAEALHDWMDGGPTSLEGLSRLTAADQQQEALAIAMILRDALETPGARAALVTPDRGLAQRVAAALLRFGIVADDSAGEPLADTPPAVFLRLLVRAVAEDLAPVPLLALLKHPFCAVGISPIASRDSARALEVHCLRGPRPSPGVAGLRRAVDAADAHAPALKSFLARLESCLEPALRFETAMALPPRSALDAVIETAERLATTDTIKGSDRLWAGEEGEALAARLSEVRDTADLLPDLQRGVLPGLLDQILEGAVVRSRKALRGKGGTEHPRIFIWGLLEARLQSVDVAVLGGLAEGVWPPAAEPGPWLSRPMRKTVGLPAPEEDIGQAAHDFLATCCSAPQVVLSSPARRDNAPAVPARWLTRLDMFLAARGQTLPDHPAAGWVQALDQPDGGPKPVAPPRPKPPVRLRPRRLSVTAIETWLRDPYAIHARHILRLPVLKPLDEGTDAADYGMIVHDAMHRFLRKHGAAWPLDAPEELRSAMRRALAEAGLRPALQAWWLPRLERIADWVAGAETARRTGRSPTAILSEASGRIELSRPGGPFLLTGRADRIERYPDGTLAILDYKTGRPPSQNAVDAGLAPQLVLEAAMAAHAGFGEDWTGEASELAYWHLTGGSDPGKIYPLFRNPPGDIPAAAADALDKLCALIDAFDRPDKAYLSRPHPDYAMRFADYEQLARVAEWSSAGGDDE